MQEEAPSPTTDLSETLANRPIFDSLVYTPWQEALKELERRQSDPSIGVYLDHTLPHGVPETLRGKKIMALFRHIATSNYEIHRFMMVADSLGELEPVILEYLDDKFNDRNEGKYFLGKLCFHKGTNKNGEAIWESVRIIDFNASNNKPISSLHTSWGESFVGFHHDLFRQSFPKHTQGMLDLSDWLRSIGGAREYYKAFLSLFLRGGILFENFYPNGVETQFTRDVVLPSIMEITKETGMKPLIVTLAPTEIEGDQFWQSHPYREKSLIEERIAAARTV